MRAVFDTVVFVRALIDRSSRAGRLLFELGAGYQLLISPAIEAEVIDVLYRANMRARFPQMILPVLQDVMAIVAAAEVVDAEPTARVCRDPNDDMFFDCAREGSADIIVSEDNDILSVGRYGSVRTVNIETCIAMLMAEAG